MNFVFNQSGDGNTQIGSIGRGPEWVRTADRLPENDDNWVIGLWQLNDGRLIPDAVPSGTLIRLSKKAFPYWMPLPKLPEVEE